MNEVHVVFQGMVLWWMASHPGQVVIPDLTKFDVKHKASITAEVTAFRANECPPGFTRFPENGRTLCRFSLDGAGDTGGVQIELATNRPARRAPDLCRLPTLRRKGVEDLVLAPEFTPPSGSGNSAWMTVTGGSAVAGVVECDIAPDCPRYTRWTVDAAEHSNVVLILKNLKSGADVVALLNPGATLAVANIPDHDVLNARMAERKKGGQRETAMQSGSEDWCVYFRMVRRKGRPGEPVPCPGKPPIPSCTTPEVVLDIPTHIHRKAALFPPVGPFDTIETVACSNSPLRCGARRCDHGPRARRAGARRVAPMERSSREILDSLDVVLRQLEIRDGQIFAHVLDVRRAGERQHAGLNRKAEDELCGRAAGAFDDLAKSRAAQLVHVRGEEREALVDDAVGAAERAHLGIPAGRRVAAVLHELRLHRRDRKQLFELMQGHVADAEETRFAGRVQLFHRLPRFAIFGSEAAAAGGTVEDVGVERGDAQMLERRRERLPHLRGDGRAASYGRRWS